MNSRLCFLAIWALLNGIAAAGETLHCIVIDSPVHDLLLLREELKLTGPPEGGKAPELFSTLGGPREVIFQGSASLDDKPRVTLGTGGKGKAPAPRGRNDPGLTLAVEKAPDERHPSLRYAASLLLAAKPGGYFRFQTAGLNVSIVPNRWQEVATWSHGIRCLTLCQYVEVETPPPAPLPPPPGVVDVKGYFALDVIFNARRTTEAAHAPDLSPDLARLTLEDMIFPEVPWKVFHLPCRPEVPFSSQSTHGSLQRIGEAGYDDKATATFAGSVTVREDGAVSLTGQLTASPDAAGAVMSFPFTGDSKLGEWKFISLPDGPRCRWTRPLFPGWWRTEPDGLARINLLAFRVSARK